MLVVARPTLHPSAHPGPRPQSAVSPTDDGTPRIVVDATVTHQTITGWEATAQAGQNKSPVFETYRDRLIDLAVNDLGINRLRVEVRSGSEHTRDLWALRGSDADEDDPNSVWRALRYSTINDNNDPFVLNARGFWFSEIDSTIEKVALPMKRMLQARGEDLFINVNYVAFTRGLAPGLEYHHQDPEEYAEYVQAFYQHLRTRFGFLPDSWEIVLEPNNTREWNPSLVRRAMIAAGNRLKSMGIVPRFVAPSASDMNIAVLYIDDMTRDGPPRFWAELSYHRYGGSSEAALRGLGARAQQFNMATAMLERGGAGVNELHDDLKIAGNTAWSQYGLAYPAPVDNGGAYYLIDDSNQAAPRIIEGVLTKFLRQYFKYVRNGAVRIDAETSDGTFDPVAFVNANGSWVVVVKAARGGVFAIDGLAPGQYNATYTTSRDSLVPTGPVSIEPGARVRLGIPDQGVLTIFGAVGAGRGGPIDRRR